MYRTAPRNLLALVFSLFLTVCLAQEQLSLSGNIESNVNFYIKYRNRGSQYTTIYEHQKGRNGDLVNFRASYAGFDVGIRYDILPFSPAQSTDSYTTRALDAGISGRK